MAIDQLPNRPAEPPTAAPSDLDVPAWLQPETTITKEPAAPRATVAAATTGRAIGTAAGWLGTGLRGAARAWVEAYHDDYPHMINVARAEIQAAEYTRAVAAAADSTPAATWRAERRRHRLLHLGKTGAGTLITTGTASPPAASSSAAGSTSSWPSPASAPPPTTATAPASPPHSPPGEQHAAIEAR
jgi:hypothetical protein